MKLFEAIKIMHAGKHQVLNVKSCNGGYSWHPEEDEGYCKYVKAIWRMYEHPILEWLLRFLKII